MERNRQDTGQQHTSAVEWTGEQRSVIEARGKSLLVSAAAGSGKTAVLVERILSMVTDPADPIDVDELLVVTFTNAAAAEMRERILNALSAAADADPENLHLQRQLSLIHNAQITTVDSFCLQVVMNHFHRISLEPGFRIADEGELSLMQEDVCDAVLEEFYAAREEPFLRFMAAYGGAKSDENIRGKILELYKYSQSYPWPRDWLDSCAAQYGAESIGELREMPWFVEYLAQLHARVEGMVTQYRQILALSRADNGPDVYAPALESELAMLEGLLSCDSYEAWQDALSRVDFASLPSYRGENKDAAKSIQDIRNRIKKRLTEYREKDFAADPADLTETLKQTGAMAQTLVDLTEAFAERFAREKAKKNILDFSDCEHFALQILVDPETRMPTETAFEYRQKFREVMVDEYQDSNYLQEEILNAISGVEEGRENRFMVGDVKQSIYGFRQARQELFMEKYNAFSREENPTQRIDLHQNFRSRPQILAVVNDLFGRIMAADLGNIEYDADAALYQGRRIADAREGDASPSDVPDGEAGRWSPECILVEPVEGEEARRTEARVIAGRIRAMVEEQEIPGVEYRDIAILLRALKGWTEAFVDAFEEAGVPILVASQTGYFSAQEVRVVMSLLRVLDNPRQDIPLAALMRSPIGTFSDGDLAAIKAVDGTAPFFDCVRQVAGNPAAADGVEEDLRGRTARFWDVLSDFRGRVPYTPIHTLIQQIYDETGYRDYVTALPGGGQRRANLDMLLERAVTYENTSYHGLYHFVRYIDRLIKYDVDYGEAETVSERENAVRLTTIHKSKGLEYPVVFVAGMGKEFNLTDASGDMILHRTYGIGIKWCDPEKRTKSDTLIRRAFSNEALKDSLGEELRVLYVALTRAKEKLILTGMKTKSGPAVFEGLAPYEKLGFAMRMDARNYWDWVLPALASYGGAYTIQTVGEDEREIAGAVHRLHTQNARETLLHALCDTDGDLLQELNDRFSWEYPYRQDGLKQKMSVSEIKHRAMREARDILEEDGGEELFPEDIPRPYIPKFVKTPEENTGALRGTAFHRLMECLDFASLPCPADPKKAQAWLAGALGELRESGRMTEEDAAVIDAAQVGTFLCCDMAQRMAAAARRDRLVREQPFVMSVSADRIRPGADAQETVLIQGIIDAYWEEEDGIVLLDYKTDRVACAKELTARYQAQLWLYAEALGRRFADRRVKEILIYSFRLDEVIPVAMPQEKEDLI